MHAGDSLLRLEIRGCTAWFGVPVFTIAAAAPHEAQARCLTFAVTVCDRPILYGACFTTEEVRRSSACCLSAWGGGVGRARPLGQERRIIRYWGPHSATNTMVALLLCRSTTTSRQTTPWTGPSRRSGESVRARPGGCMILCGYQRDLLIGYCYCKLDCFLALPCRAVMLTQDGWHLSRPGEPGHLGRAGGHMLCSHQHQAAE